MEIIEALTNQKYWKPNLTAIAKATGKAPSTVKAYYELRKHRLEVSVREVPESEAIKKESEHDE